MQDKIVTGLFLGDEAKGSTTAKLCSLERPSYVVRTGGPQAAHNVYEGGIHHKFAQFGSGSLQEIPTILSKHMMVNPFNLVTEGDVLHQKTGWNPFPDLLISESSLASTPIHAWITKKREEARGVDAHGSTGEGISAVRAFERSNPVMALRMKHLKENHGPSLYSQFKALVDANYDIPEIEKVWNQKKIDRLVGHYIALMNDGFLNIVKDEKISHILASTSNVYESSQGVLLDEKHGFFPNNTWVPATSEPSRDLLRQAGKDLDDVEVVGVTRSYGTRHGFGPFPSELPNTDEFISRFPELHNAYGRYQGGWRRGWLDLPLLSYAIDANQGVDVISLTHCDFIEGGIKVVVGYKNGWIAPPKGYNALSIDRQAAYTAYLNTFSLEDAVLTEVSTADELSEIIEAEFNVPVKYKSFNKEFN